MFSRLFLLAAGGLGLSGPRALSATYTQEATAVDFGGRAVASANYALHGSLAVGEAAASPNYRTRGGFLGQLSEAVSLNLTSAPSSPLTENLTRQCGAYLTLDDDSRLILAPTSLHWQVIGAPLASISAGGLLSAGYVYQNTVASVQGSYLGYANALAVTISNLGLDDFGPFAADGLPDLWQVGYFGENALAAVAGLNGDGDGDGLTNLQEYAFGTAPGVNSSAAVRWLGSTLQARGVPTQYINTAPGSFAFRVVFARRQDFAAARLKYTAEFSADLLLWQASSATPTVLASDGEIQAVSVPYPFGIANRKAAYFRVRVERLP